MSLRSYLFSLIGGLIILLTVSQLVLIHWIEDSLTKEVNVKAQVISDRVIELAIEEFDKQDGSTTLVHPSSNHDDANALAQAAINVLKANPTQTRPSNIKIIQTQNENITIINDSDVLADQSSTTAADNQNHSTNHIKIIRRELSSEFKSLVNKIHQDKSPIKDKDLALFVQTPDSIQKQFISSESTSSQSRQLIQYIQWGLIICGALALALAYYLSVQFNKPLKDLSGGFKELAKGNYQHQVNASGVNEIRQTINRFNIMVNHLDKLTKESKYHNEIAHLAELGEISRGLAHALRNPIHTIGLSIEQLSDNNLTQAQQQTLIHTVQHKIAHIDKSIKGLLTLTTEGITRNENIPLLAVVQDIILEYKSCQLKPQKFTLNISHDIYIQGDESEIRSILHTLIYNACDANKKDKMVIITAKSDIHNQVSISIKDQGLGVDKDILTQLFQPHISTKPEGAGMGLYIANRIINLHYNGSISLKNEPEGGCLALASFNQKDN